MTDIALKPTLVADGLARLVNDFQSKPNIVNILATWLRAVKRYDDVAVALISAYLLDGSIGVQLDHIGVLIGEPRAGRTDDDYRFLLKLSAIARASRGRTIDTFDILAMLRDVLGASVATTYEESFAGTDAYALSTASYSIYMIGAAVDPNTVAHVLGFAKPAGFCARLVSSSSSASSVVSYGSVTTATGNGYGTVTDNTIIRQAAHAQEIKT